MIFASDNWAGAAPEVSEGLSKASTGLHAAYGGGEMDLAFKAKVEEIFQHEAAVFTVGTGTAANSLALASVSRAGAHVMCHLESHLVEDECNAPEFFMGAGRMVGIEGENGHMNPGLLRQELARYDPAFVHHGQPVAISVTQATEFGTVHSLDQIAEYGAIAREHGLMLHMDGARFANALVALDTTPAEMTWKRGVDMVSFGGTKNGCWCAEALIVFDKERARQMAFHHKRAAQLYSKNRFISAQFNAYLQDDLWLRLAKNANEMAAKLADGIQASSDARLPWPSQANMVFMILKKEKAARLRKAGAVFHPFHTPRNHRNQLAENEGIYRLVTNFGTRVDEVDSFLELLK